MQNNELENCIKEATSVTDACFRFYGNKYYGNRITIKNYIKDNDIDTSHFNPCKGGGIDNFKKKPLSDILVEDSAFDTTNLKHRLYDEGIKLRVCELCGQGELWNGKHLSLILDHKNGNHRDHRIENLRIVCPNCDATLPTFSGKNVIR